MTQAPSNLGFSASARAPATRRREPPLTPAALAVQDQHLGALHVRLQRRSAEALPLLEIVRFEDGVVVLGPEEALPWVDHGLYLGREPQAIGLLVPSREQANVPLDLFERALRRRLGDVPGTLAVLPGWQKVVPLNGAVRLSSSLLTAGSESDD